jgi:hypothetical protein
LCGGLEQAVCLLLFWLGHDSCSITLLGP